MSLIEYHLKQEFSDRFFKFILNNRNKDWDWFHISENSNITIKTILDNPYEKWNWYGIV